MDKLHKLSEEFKFEYEKFLNGCDAIEELNQWDKDALGEMDAYYSADLVSVILRLVAADGVFAQKEAEYINDIFGFSYSPQELQTLYEDCGEAIENSFNEGVENGYTRMRSINTKLADAYRELLLLVCDIIIESDGIIDKAEVSLAEKLKAL